jgi:hypothetical protein
MRFSFDMPKQTKKVDAEALKASKKAHSKAVSNQEIVIKNESNDTERPKGEGAN